MHTSIIIYVYIFYLCKCISLLFHHFVIFLGVKNKLLVLVLVPVHGIGTVCVPLWMHILDNDKHSKTTRRVVHKTATSCFQQTQAATSE